MLIKLFFVQKRVDLDVGVATINKKYSSNKLQKTLTPKD